MVKKVQVGGTYAEENIRLFLKLILFVVTCLTNFFLINLLVMNRDWTYYYLQRLKTKQKLSH